jgi:DNA-binding transcriptional regulator YiaG
LPFYNFSVEFPTPKPDGYPKELKTIGDGMRTRRLDLELEQKDIAHIFSVSLDTITNWELNRHTPGIWLGKEIIAFLGYDPLPAPTNLPEKMRAFRWKEGLRSKDAACRAYVDPSTWAKWERGDRVPSKAYIKRLNSIGVFQISACNSDTITVF